MGRAKQKQYQYSETLHYLRSYESQSEVFEKYYDSKKGELYPTNIGYKELPDGTYITPERGRDRLRKLIDIANDPLCGNRADDKEIYVYNRLGEVVATYKNIRVAAEMSNLTYQAISNRLLRPTRFSNQIWVFKK